MDHGKTLWYCGSDDGLFTRLSDVLPPQGFDVRRAGEVAAMADDCAADWYRVLLLDGNVAEPPLFDFIHAMRERSAAVPLIVVSPSGEHRLTQVAMARQFGAETILFKPIADLAPLVEVIAVAFERLDGWRRTLRQVQSSSSTQPHPVC